MPGKNLVEKLMMNFNFEKFIDNLELNGTNRTCYYGVRFRENCQWCGRVKNKMLKECICIMNKKARLVARNLQHANA